MSAKQCYKLLGVVLVFWAGSNSAEGQATVPPQDDQSPHSAGRQARMDSLLRYVDTLPPEQNRIIVDYEERLETILHGKSSPEIYHLTPEDEPEIRLMKQRINCLYEDVNFRSRRGMVDGASVYADAVNRLYDARLEFHKDPKLKREILVEKLSHAQRVEKLSILRLGHTLVNSFPATDARLQVELELLRFDKNHPQIANCPTE